MHAPFITIHGEFQLKHNIKKDYIIDINVLHYKNFYIILYLSFVPHQNFYS